MGQDNSDGILPDRLACKLCGVEEKTVSAPKFYYDISNWGEGQRTLTIEHQCGWESDVSDTMGETDDEYEHAEPRSLRELSRILREEGIISNLGPDESPNGKWGSFTHEWPAE